MNKNIIPNIEHNNRENKLKNKNGILRKNKEYFLDLMEELYKSNKKRTDNLNYTPKLNKKEAMVITLFDSHYGEEIKRDGKIIYNFDIADNRVRKYLRNAIEYYIINSRSIDEVYFVLGGDNIDGDGTVYPHHIQEIEDSFNQQIKRYQYIVLECISTFSKLLDNKKLHVIGVAGNHGSNKRNTAAHPIRDNYDTGLYLYLSAMLDYIKLNYNDLLNVYMNFSTETEYYNFNIKGWNFQARHRLPKNFNTPSTKVVVHGWRELHEIDCILTGHYHDGAVGNIGKTKLIRIGSLAGANDYSESLGLFGEAEQTLLIVSKDRLIKNYMPINLS